MHTDSITVRLRLPGVVVLGARESDHEVEVVVRYANEEATCPRCGHGTWQVHQWHRQWKRDAPVWGKRVWVLLWKRRFRCRICRKVFTEEDPACGRWRRTTARLRRQAGQQAQEASVRAVARWLGVSEELVERSWQEVYGQVAPPRAPHVFLGLDGFCARRRSRMWTGLWDLETRQPVAVIAGERQRDVELLLERHADRAAVRAVAIDLAEVSRRALQVVLPHAIVVADKFHVVALAGRALREVRQGRRQRGNIAWLMDRALERLEDDERARLMAALDADPRVAQAWALKEGLRLVYRSRTRPEAEAALEDWLRAAKASGLEPFCRTAATLQRWQDEVLNYWRYPISNAIVEGKHNRVKVLKRRAYGYRNERNFMLRILNLIHTD